MTTALTKPIAPARYEGWQPGIGRRRGFHLYTLTADIPGHPAGSTVSKETLEAAGFDVSQVEGGRESFCPVCSLIGRSPDIAAHLSIDHGWRANVVTAWIDDIRRLP